ncbi:MAG: winged helix-turn-helix domain-containing protein [Acidobacteriaceae bacterium]
MPSRNDSICRFGRFELDLSTGELRKGGVKLRLQDQQFQVLVKLIEHKGEIVSREELRSALWHEDTFVDFETGLNTAIKRLRETLGDSADNPIFIETLPRRGYRFVAPVRAFLEAPPSSNQSLATGRTTSDVNRLGVKKSRLGALVLIAALIAVIVVGLTVWIRRVLTAPQVRVLRFVKLTNDGQAKTGRMATDGVRVYFEELLPGQLRALAQVSTTGGDVVRIATPLNQPRLLDLSRDGTEMLLASQEEVRAGSQECTDSLWIQPSTGGSPRRVGSGCVHDAAWDASGEMIIYREGDGVFLIKGDGTNRHQILSQGRSSYSFSFSPDGQVLRFSLGDGSHDPNSIMETTARGGSVRTLFPGCCGKWTPDGRYFVFQRQHEGRTDLWVLPESRAFLWKKTGNQPIQLTDGPLEFEAPISSKDGKEIFAIGKLRRAEVVRYDSRTREFTPYFRGVSAEGLAFSEDGKWVAYTSYPDGTLWRSRTDGSERLQLTFPPMRVLLPKWSPDGQQIAFAAASPGHPWNIYLVPMGGGEPRQLLPDADNRVDVNWSPDGDSLLFGSFDLPDHPIWIYDLRKSRVSTLPGSVGLFSPRWSPNGRYVCAITQQRPFRLKLFDFKTQKWTQLFDSDMGYPSWSRDSHYIYFEVNSSPVDSARIDRVRLSDRKVETIVDLKTLGRSATGIFDIEWIGFAPDGSPLVARDISTQEIYALKWRLP